MTIIKNLSVLNRHHAMYKSYNTIVSSIEHGLNSVDPYLLIQKKIKKKSQSKIAVKGNFQYEKSISLNLDDYKNIFVIGAGKAVGRMTMGMEKVLNERISGGAIIVPYGQKNIISIISNISVFEAGHPLSDQNGIRGSTEIVNFLHHKRIDDSLIFCLLSGGGSSLFSLPIEGINLKEKNKIIKSLMESGSPIRELNIVRKHLSKIKGGKLIQGLGKYSQKYRLISFILSDVIGDRIDTIASGPTVPDNSTCLDAIKILKKYRLWDSDDKEFIKVKNIFLKNISSEEQYQKNHAKIFRNVSNYLIGNNALLCKNIKSFVNNQYIKNDQNVMWIRSQFRGEAKNLANKITDFFYKTSLTKKKKFFCIIGGESTVNLKNDRNEKSGIGGRNQEVSFKILYNLSKKNRLPQDFCIACIGSDGIDGNSPSAGGIITNASISLLKNEKIDSELYLKHHDTFTGLNLVKSDIVTGLTGTNVNDIIMICYYR